MSFSRDFVLLIFQILHKDTVLSLAIDMRYYIGCRGEEFKARRPKASCLK